MQLSDWSNLNLPQLLVLGGIAVVLLALILYFIPAIRFKAPAIFVCTLGGLALGVGIGMMCLVASGYRKEAPDNRADSRVGEDLAKQGAAPAGEGAGKGRGMPAGGGMGMG